MTLGVVGAVLGPVKLDVVAATLNDAKSTEIAEEYNDERIITVGRELMDFGLLSWYQYEEDISLEEDIPLRLNSGEYSVLLNAVWQNNEK